jgi:hypothetical protein
VDVCLKNNRVGYPSVMNFEGQSVVGAKDICNLFADFIKRTYAENVQVSKSGLLL